MTNQLTPRARAGAILSGPKMRMLEDAGLTVVDMARLEGLERVAKHAMSYRVAVADELSDQIDHSVKRLSLFAALDQLEAMIDGR